MSNATVVRVDDGLVLVDPGIDGSDLEELADDVDQLGLPVVAGFATHPHWDHLLWHHRFGDVPRYATPACAERAANVRERGRLVAAESAPGIPVELFGLVSPVPKDGGLIAGEVIEHGAHAVGHAALLLRDQGVLVAGDLCSDVLIPLLDAERPDQVAAFETALDLLDAAAGDVEVLIPGHGSMARGSEVAARIAADRAYIEALASGGDPVDVRLEQDWLTGPHQANLASARSAKY